MPTQDPLFQLIKSLDSSEKRYFKTNAKKGGEAKSNYVQLFEAMDAQGDDYDEAELKRKHSKKPFVKYLSAEKKYLREQIMKQMRAYRSELSVDNKINELLQDERFYQSKGLNDLRGKSLIKAKELATSYERYHLLREVLRRQMAYLIEFEKKNITEPVVQLINEQKQVSIIEEISLDLQTKNRELFSIQRSGSDMQNPTVKNRVEMLFLEIERHRLHINQSNTLRCNFERACSNYYHLTRDWKSSLNHVINEYLVYQQSENLKSEDSSNYKICLANLMTRAQTAGDNEWFEKALNEMKQLPTVSFNEDGEVFQNVYFQEHLYYINQGDFQKAVELVPIIEQGLVKYDAKINLARKLSFQFNIMVMYFIMHDFKKALEWTTPLLDDKSEIKQNQKFVTVLLLPFIHFELGHVEIVESYARSAYRLLSRKNRLHSFERLVLKYLEKMPLSPTEQEFKPKSNELSAKLDLLRDDPKIPMVLGMEEISLWAKSHVTGKKMCDLLIEQANTIG